MTDPPLVLASRNKGKIAEFEKMATDFGIEIKNLNDFKPIPAAKEDGKNFEENALKKARLTAKVLGLPALADDSGLIVHALDGMPGVHSARYAGENATDEENNLKLLRALEGIKDRHASFICVIAIAVPQGDALIYKGMCDGLIAYEPAGGQGFGYDSLFYYPPLDKTFAQMPAEEKNRVSHRGEAMEKLRNEFDRVMVWLRQKLNEKN